MQNGVNRGSPINPINPITRTIAKHMTYARF